MSGISAAAVGPRHGQWDRRLGFLARVDACSGCRTETVSQDVGVHGHQLLRGQVAHERADADQPVPTLDHAAVVEAVHATHTPPLEQG